MAEATSNSSDPDYGYTADEAIGFTVNEGLFVRHATRRRLAHHLGITGPAVGRKIRGTTGWSAEDLIRPAEFLGVEPASLLPRRVDGAPAVGGGGGAGAVPRTGFEPAAFCSEGRVRADVHVELADVVDLQGWRFS